MKNIFPLALLLFVVLGCRPSASDTTKGPSQPPPNEVAQQVSADSLTRAYEANEIAADGVYKGKLLSVTGKVQDISETFGTIQVDLEGHKNDGIGFVTVKCSIDESQRSRVASLVKGSTATLIGRGDGMTAGLFVGLEECRIK